MLILALLWLLWCSLHSLLITRRVGRWINSRGGAWAAGYRMGYVLFSLLSLIPLLWYQAGLEQRILFRWQGAGRLVQGTLLAYALFMFLGGKQVYDLDWFLGLSQWRAFRRGERSTGRPFRCHGVLQLVRHPWYSGGLALLWALNPLTDASLVSRIILTAYLIVGTRLEERKLLEELGDVYARYQRRVPMLIPWPGRRNPS